MTAGVTLAFAASHGDGAVALLKGSQVLTAVPIGKQGTHNAGMLVVADELLCSHGLNWHSLTSLAVDIGPGSFTGIRLALSAARAFAWLGSLPLHTVNSLDVLAVHAAEATGLDSFALCLDARRSAFYRSVYSNHSGLQRLQGPELVTLDGLRHGLPDGCALVGRFPASAAAVLAEGPAVELVPEYRPADFARVVARAVATGSAVEWTKALPLYLRRPEAEEVWESRYGRPDPPSV